MSGTPTNLDDRGGWKDGGSLIASVQNDNNGVTKEVIRSPSGFAIAAPTSSETARRVSVFRAANWRKEALMKMSSIRLCGGTSFGPAFTLVPDSFLLVPSLDTVGWGRTFCGFSEPTPPLAREAIKEVLSSGDTVDEVGAPCPPELFLPVTSSIMDETKELVSNSTLEDATSSRTLVSGKLELRFSLSLQSMRNFVYWSCQLCILKLYPDTQYGSEKN